MSEEVVYVSEHEVSCSGKSNKTVGHPKVYLNFGANKEIMCPYCSRKFVHSEKKN